MIRFLVAGNHQGLTVVEWLGAKKVNYNQLLSNETSADSTFALAQNSLDGDILFAPNHFYDDSLYVLRNGFPQKVKDIYKPGPKELQGEPFDWHGATWSEIGYLVTSTRFGLAWLKEGQKEIVFNGFFRFDYDSIWHLNSVLVHNGFFYLAFHRLSQKQKVPSEVAQFIPNSSNMKLKLNEKWTLGRDIHDLVYVPDIGMLTCSSAENRILGVGCDFELDISPSDVVQAPYVRGLYYQQGFIFVGKSCQANREDRLKSNCEIDVYDIATQDLVDRIALQTKGSILQMIGFK